jgi:hypothetical protein
MAGDGDRFSIVEAEDAVAQEGLAEQTRPHEVIVVG